MTSAGRGRDANTGFGPKRLQDGGQEILTTVLPCPIMDTQIMIATQYPERGTVKVNIVTMYYFYYIVHYNFLVNGQCFVDNEVGLRNLPYKAYSSSTNTIEKCKSVCFEKNYRYAGVQFAKECFCGNNAPEKIAPTESDCNMDCSGDKSQKCGGPNRMNVYQNQGKIT